MFRFLQNMSVVLLLLAFTATGAAANGFLSGFGSTVDIGYDTFRGMTDAGRQDNSGTNVGANLGMLLQPYGSYDVGVQLGASHGVYDWRGRVNTTTGYAIDKPMRQTFVTAGFFHHADYYAGDRIGWGIVYDWMVGGNWGLVGNDGVTLTQWRGQVSYALNENNDIGLLGMLHGRDDMGGPAGGMTVNHYESINQLNFFLDHRFTSGASGRVWLGIPQGSALDRPGSTIDLLLGASVAMPLNDYWEAYGSFQYGNPSGSGNAFIPGYNASTEIYSSVAFGVIFYPSGRASIRNPLMPIADNSSFLVDNGRL